MEIFGISLSQAHMWLLGIAGALIMLPLSVYFTANYKRRRDSVEKFRDAFDDVLLNLRENPDCPIAQIAYACHAQHLAAIDKFRDNVPFWRRRGFEKAVEHYKEAYNIARDYGSKFAIVASEKTDRAKEKRLHFLKSIQNLLSYAGIEVII